MLGRQLCSTEVGDKKASQSKLFRLDAVSFLCPAFFFMLVSKSRGSPTFAGSPVSFCTADPSAVYYIRKQLPLLANNL